jgi:putative transcriptional regulator
MQACGFLAKLSIKKNLHLGKRLIAKGDTIRTVFTTHFAKRVKAVRMEKGLTQEQVAYLAGIDDAHLGHLEIGRDRVSLFLAWKIANALDVSLDELTDVSL